MSLSVGIVGLPNVGKSTLFKALTKKAVDISNYPFCTIEPNIGIVEVPDEKLDKLIEISQAKKVVPSIIKFVDVAGLVKGAAKGEGLGNQFLAHLREADALLQIVRCFCDENIAHVNGTINPKRDIETVESELILKDLETVEKRMQKIERDVKQGSKEAKMETEVLEGVKIELEKGNSARIFFSNLGEMEEGKKKLISNLFLLTIKPQIYLLNCTERADNGKVQEDLKKELEKGENDVLPLDLRNELDKSELTEEERKELGLEIPEIDKLVKKCYKILELITFFTIVGKEETRAWSIKRGSTVWQGAGKVHSDFQEKFIRAEVINWQELLRVGGWKKAGEAGLLKTVSKDYILKDGDVVEIKHN